MAAEEGGDEAGGLASVSDEESSEEVGTGGDERSSLASLASASVVHSAGIVVAGEVGM